MTSQTFVDLSRWQFATTAAFHMTFPALSVGLAIFLVICYGAYHRTGNPLHLQMFWFWRKISAPPSRRSKIAVCVNRHPEPARTRVEGAL
jgi:hypothetical protein